MLFPSREEQLGTEVPGPVACGVACMIVPHELVDDFVQGRASVFVGAGLSTGAGLISWNELTLRLAGELRIDPRAASPLDVAQRYQDRFGSARLVEELSQYLSTLDVKPTQAHSVLVDGLHLEKIFTTNFEDVLELACRDAGRAPHVAYDSATYGIFPAGFFRIVKLHGHLDAPRSIVLATTDFKQYLRTHPALATGLQNEFQTSTVLFIGYGFADPDIQAILKRVNRTAGRFARRHYIVMLDPDDATKKRLADLDLTVIECSTDGRSPQDAVTAWLQALQRAVLRLRPLDRGQDLIAVPDRTVELIGRDAHCESVLASLNASTRIVVLSGAPGIGKSSVAIQVARKWVDEAAPGRRKAVWFAAREHEARSGWLNELVDQIAINLGIEYVARRGADELEWKTSEVAKALAQPRLLVLDNMESAHGSNIDALWRWLRRLPIQTRVLITCRPQMARSLTAAGFAVIDLPGLSDADALRLLERYVYLYDDTGALSAETSRFSELVSVVLGNPELLKLTCMALEHRVLPFDELVSQLRASRASTDVMFELLLSLAWYAADADDMRRLLMCTSLFVSATVPHGIVSRIAGLAPQIVADAATDRAVQWGLLEPTQDRRRYFVHPRVREFAAEQLKKQRYFERDVRRACAERYLAFVRDVVERGRRLPDVPYWNALVSEDMNALDIEWPMIRAQLDWAVANKDIDVLRQFVLLLVHYMDSRCLNPDRLRYVTCVVRSMDDNDCPQDLALLHLDALAWTHLEEGDAEHLKQALEEIDRGEQISQLVSEGENDLMALAKAWRALVFARQERTTDSRAMIAEALSLADVVEPWIRMRVFMAAGDIALMGDAVTPAFEHYQRALDASFAYGEDGMGYQLLPRIGLAMTMLDGALDEAQAHFDGIRARGIPSGKLYGDYGLGLVEYARGRSGRGRSLIQATRHALRDRRASSFLGDLMNARYRHVDPHAFSADEEPPSAPTVLLEGDVDASADHATIVEHPPDRRRRPAGPTGDGAS